MTNVILDTNTYSSFMAGDPQVLRCLVESQHIYISAVVIGELYAGFYGGSRLQENAAELKRFLSKDRVSIVDVTVVTSEIFGEIKSVLRAKGTMVPLNDIWVAAHAVEYGSKLLTYDSHFRQIPLVRLWEYV
ncbi:MAG: type II toxin-antitoxin system VapC family toxin [Spirochaetaceae bacterium]